MIHERIVTVPLDEPLGICAPAEGPLVTAEGARVLASTKGRVLAPVPSLLGRFDVVRRGRRLGLLFPSLREVDGGGRDEQRRGARAEEGREARRGRRRAPRWLERWRFPFSALRRPNEAPASSYPAHAALWVRSGAL